MTLDLQTQPISRRFEHLLKVVSSDRFLQKEGLGNEVPFFICPFKVHETNDMQAVQRDLIVQLANKGIQILPLNLYDICLELLKERGILEQILEKESDLAKDELLELLQGVLDPEQHLIPAIAQRMAPAEFDVLFLSGAGEVFPYIRTHNVLNNLQSTAKDQPTLLFFPGEYTHSLEDGASLDLFGKLRDDKYYRAFNIYHCEA